MLQQRVQQIIDELVASGEETGLQVAAYVNGELVVDAWAGVADETTGRLVNGETLFTSWSTTKGFVATCLHLLADRDQVQYDTPVARYWPEFSANGKETVTVRDAITHRAGIPYMPTGVTPEMMTDWDAMCTMIAGHAPLWQPGSTVCYHAWTFGWIIGEIIRPPQVTSAAVVNRPDFRRASIPGGGGIMSARAIARHYAMLAGDGLLDGTRLLDEPEAPLSPTRQITLLMLLRELAQTQDTQFIIATHSPILMALPDSAIYSFDGGAIHPIKFNETEHVMVTQAFLANPARFLGRVEQE